MSKAYNGVRAARISHAYGTRVVGQRIDHHREDYFAGSVTLTAGVPHDLLTQFAA
ncbi:hypothetical protein [Sphingomonas phyllosphaerae]|uniref:hypothetical protein n=1 Tax=Sphingomonas phyllosphaerae TaxID=257003 RepID=UPI0012DE1FA7|nr:hypothetical protein [Sphingomonas phyllosphaerae]